MIQIDLPIPESCYDCPMNYDFSWCLALSREEWEKYEDDWSLQVGKAEHRPEYCPLKEQPEIIMCKDCKHMKVLPCDIHGHIPIYCTNLSIYSEGLDWFCADGRRKEE